MSAVQFNNSGSLGDRRRRRLVVEMDTEVVPSDAELRGDSGEADRNNSAFPMLSRDRLIRRIISPRLWKHLTVAIVLTFTPIIFAFSTWSSTSTTDVSAAATITSQLDVLRGLSGLKLFAAAQFCLVIGWVRSASAVDFRGRYRWWRWMAIGLFAASFMLLTGSTDFFINLFARMLQPVFGRIDSARPALLIVPAGAGLALILRRLIPDMGRCRLAQSLVVCSAVMLVIRAFAGTRLKTPTDLYQLTTFELLISGLLLSAFQLHARFVIHVNPNPPLSADRKTAAPVAMSQLENIADRSVGPVESVPNESMPAVAVLNAVADSDAVPGTRPPTSLETTMKPIDLESESQSLAPKSSASSTQLADAGDVEIQIEHQTTSRTATHTKGKASKKQKLRKAS